MKNDNLKENEKKERAQLIIEVDPDILHDFKIKCLQQKKTMKEVITGLVKAYLSKII